MGARRRCQPARERFTAWTNYDRLHAVLFIKKSVCVKVRQMSDQSGKATAFSRRLGARELLTRLAEQERIRGHHSPEGQAIRTLCRALSGWGARTLASNDVIIMCDQAIHDWLAARLAETTWSKRPFTELIERAVLGGLLERQAGRRLLQVHSMRQCLQRRPSPRLSRVAAILRFCIELVERRW
jgi:hypothetical protein